MAINTEDGWAKRSRTLTQLLILSGALNIGLITSFFHFIVKEKESSVAFELAPGSSQETPPSLSSLLSSYMSLSFGELLTLLTDTEPVELGFKKRDLALSMLVSFHCFNLEKVIPPHLLQKRELTFVHREGKGRLKVPAFSGVTDEQFQGIIQYAKVEKWPLTAEGLFLEIKSCVKEVDPTLTQAFELTAEFHALMTLFTQGGLPLPKELVMQLVREGNWSVLQLFTEEQKKVQDLSPDRLKHVLTRFLRERSQVAAKMLLNWDRGYVLRHLDDVELFLLLDLFPERGEAIELFARELLTSPRSDAIRKKAAEKLYALQGKEVPQPYSYELALQTFGGVVAREVEVVKSVKVGRRHLIQEGESLWKIARRYKVSVEALREANQLKGDNLRVGKELVIP